jgi:putative ATPase
MESLFDMVENEYVPLAEKLRPKTLDDFYGQEKIVGKNSPVRKMIENDLITSMIFWGPPGTGKTTLAKIIAKNTNSAFYEISAVNSGVKDIKDLHDKAINNRFNGKKTICFVDEIHRFNKAQQDAFLPLVEQGEIILIGATTENPSFEVNSALLSRCKVYVLESLSNDNIKKILKRAVETFDNVTIDDESLNLIVSISSGDARNALNTLENVINLTPSKNKKKIIDRKVLDKVLQDKTFLYDKNGEEHYNLISALHKSMRNSDPDAALYYLARMIEAGENPLYVARRLIRFASEDVGMANPNALVQAVNTYNACHYIGVPECNVNLAQCVVYLSVSPKSNALETGYMKAAEDAKRTLNLKVPLHLRNAETKLDKDLGYGEGYKYAHNYEGNITNMECLPKELKGAKYYNPTNNGNEKNVKEVLDRIQAFKNKK